MCAGKTAARSLTEKGRPVIFGITAMYRRQFPSLRIVWRRSRRSFNRSWQFDLRTNLSEARQDGEDIPEPLGKKHPLRLWKFNGIKVVSTKDEKERSTRVSFRSGKAICELSPAGPFLVPYKTSGLRRLSFVLFCALSISHHDLCIHLHNIHISAHFIYIFFLLFTSQYHRHMCRGNL